jgi:hypothetical protein
MPAAIAHDASPTTRPPAWRWLVAMVAFVAYLMAGMHLACADDFTSTTGALGFFSGSDDDAGDGHGTGHCHAAHLQVEVVAAHMPQPAMRPSRVSLARDALWASADPRRMEDPPRP